ncbi:MAG: deoxyguanosinetriphosphate triphosphohydrolase [Desulfobacteraceae bacterium]|nr:deoxyguanosinetriphosphate triphosphohydrolase [Desulfobacteraceae bacterium]MCF8095022.1 deoxyguanosinetriphosphate triphosphohydrolase [Desulfobacteraceae bacterium]
MTIREDFEKREEAFISPYGVQALQSMGRLRPEQPCPVRTVFQQDRDRIVFSNAFRRLKYKTQVFLSPLGDHYRTRLTHTLEVAEVARTISRALRLNEDLTEAVALGHDLGHTPFGHSGESGLKEIFSRDFNHSDQSLRVVDVLERNGAGLNLTHEVRDGILKHSKGFGDIIPADPGEMASTVEGRIVRFADIIAYLNHDLDDAVRSGVISESRIPETCVKVLGRTHALRATTMIRDLIYSSRMPDGTLELGFSDGVFSAMSVLRQFLYENVYRSKKVHAEFIKAKKIITETYTHFFKNPDQLKEQMKGMEMSEAYFNGWPVERIICDYIASMTDRYVLNLYNQLFVPTPLV